MWGDVNDSSTLFTREAVLNKSMQSEPIGELIDPLLMTKDGLHRFSNEIRHLGFYLKLLIYPAPLIFDYYYNQLQSLNKIGY